MKQIAFLSVLLVQSVSAFAVPMDLNCTRGQAPNNMYQLAAHFISDTEASVAIQVNITGRSKWVPACWSTPTLKLVSAAPLIMQGFFRCSDGDPDLTTLKYDDRTKQLTLQEIESSIIDSYQCQ